jgi:hypothetical protein
MKTRKKSVHAYTAFFEANEHGGYTVTIPALLGLVTEGRTWSTHEPWPKTQSG